MKKKMNSKDMKKIKLPAFLYSSPQTWWLTCASIFSTYRIKGPTEKYIHMVAALSADITSKLLYILSYPVEEAADTDPRLDMLKGALFQRYSPTEGECFYVFATQKPLQPSRKPSAVCDALRACLPSHINVDEHNYFFINMFLSLLPPLTRAQCMATKIAGITELVVFADCVHCQSTVMATMAAMDLKPVVDLAGATAIC